MNIQVHIERLILDGVEVAYGERPLLQAAVATELAALLAAGGMASGLQTGSTPAVIRTGPIQLAPEQAPAHLGRQIAQAVYQGISQ